MSIFINYLNKEAASYKENYLFFMPVFLSLGIIIFFNLKTEPSYGAIFITLLYSIICCFYKKFFKLQIAILMILLGFSSSIIRTDLVKTNILPYSEKFFHISGKIDELSRLDKGHRIILSSLKIDKLKPHLQPEKIRVTIRTKINNAYPGDRVEFNAILSKPKAPIIQGGFDLQKFLYFQKIGATGFSVSDLKIVEKSDLKENYINKLRKQIEYKITSNIKNQDEAAIASALMIGEYKFISEKTMDAIRNSGLAHILSVSGMHLSLVVFIFFHLIRYLLCLSYFVALKYNVKKIAALITICASLFYLLISGSSVPAVRAFIMTSIVMFAILFDREAISTRACLITGFLILLITPENLLGPSFQMSFAAVIALISSFEYFNYSTSSILGKTIKYPISLFISSIIATLAIAPFSIYHFNQISLSGIAANILAVPLSSFFIMPLIVASFFSFIFGFEEYILHLLSISIDALIKLAFYFGNMEFANIKVPQISALSLAILSFGMFLLFVMRSKIISIFIIFIGIIFAINSKRENIIFDYDTKNIILFENNKLYAKNRLGKFKRKVFENYFGFSGKILPLTQEIEFPKKENKYYRNWNKIYYKNHPTHQNYKLQQK